MADLLALSARFIDEGVYEGPGSVNRVTGELSELADGIAMVEAFSHVVAFDTEAGLVLFDTSLDVFGERVRSALRGWSERPVKTLVYTHGHADHVGGAETFLEEARRSGAPRPSIVAHAGVAPRFARYERTAGYNARINARQFGGARGSRGLVDPDATGELRFGPRQWVRPDTEFRDRLDLGVGELHFELRHERGETDDHLWAWIPERRAICAGDFVLWVFPNAGNPQKVQRYPLEWARALRAMAAHEPELLLPAHGLPVGGRQRIAALLDDQARALETLVEQTLALMNAGAPLDRILHEVSVPADLLERPYLRPVYDEPEFVVRNIWRLYGGWYDGDPAHLKPPPAAALAAALVDLAGGEPPLLARARAAAEAGDLRLACALVEIAVQAQPESREAHGARAEIYAQRRDGELSLMAKGIYGAAARESRARTGDDAGETR